MWWAIGYLVIGIMFTEVSLVLVKRYKVPNPKPGATYLVGVFGWPILLVMMAARKRSLKK